MSLLAQTIAYLDSGLTLEDLDRLPPRQLQRFNALLDHWEKLTSRRIKQAVRPAARCGEHASR